MPVEIPPEVRASMRALGLTDEQITSAAALVPDDPTERDALLDQAVSMIKEHNQAMSAAEAEATGQATVDVDWAGVNVTLPARPDDWDLDTLEAFEQGKAATAVRGVLGSKYDRVLAEFLRVNGRKPKVRDLESFMEAFASAYGFESPGESPASSAS